MNFFDSKLLINRYAEAHQVQVKSNEMLEEEREKNM